MKYKLYEDDKVVVYTHKKLLIGDEADVENSLIVCAFRGYEEFANHLKDSKDFWKQVKKHINELIKYVK